MEVCFASAGADGCDRGGGAAGYGAGVGHDAVGSVLGGNARADAREVDAAFAGDWARREAEAGSAGGWSRGRGGIGRYIGVAAVVAAALSAVFCTLATITQCHRLYGCAD